MAKIILHNVTVDLPIFNASSRSLKQRLLGAATGGRLATDSAGHVVVRALDNVSFELHDGDRVGIVGHNGAGKTSLLRVLGGAYLPTSGTTFIEGQIGSLIDISIGIDPEATGRENVFVRGALLGMSRSEIRQYMSEITDFADLGDFMDMPLRTYSAGMQLRLAFAISTVMRPEILLMDEWLAGGDEQFKSKMQKRFDDLISATSVLVIASHDRELILKLCNRAIWLKHGRVAADDQPDVVASEYFAEHQT
jgi:lipopolysaccharide transport system ATP-binding protein